MYTTIIIIIYNLKENNYCKNKHIQKSNMNTYANGLYEQYNDYSSYYQYDKRVGIIVIIIAIIITTNMKFNIYNQM